jgi:S-formylglutathione hydrolase FrmB
MPGMSTPVPSGSLVVHRIESTALRNNPLGDPSARDVHLYLPPGHDPARPTPAILALAGFSGTGASLFNADPLGEDMRQRLDRLIHTGACPPVILAAPDCFTRLGGNQYINSEGTGRYEDFLVQELIPSISRMHRICAWGVCGKSSGGYGAMMLGMRHPELFEALANHSGDACFEFCYLPGMPAAMDAFRDAGGPDQWLRRFWSDVNRHRRKYHAPLNIFAMAAHYSPNPKAPGGIDLPFDLQTGEFRPEVWERWRALDPVNLVDRYASALARLRLLYLDAGVHDEYGLHWGARALVARLRRAGLEPVHEEFDDGHMSTSYRYDVSVPMIAKALVGSP